LNQEYNIVKVVKIVMVGIEEDRELKGTLESKEWKNAFINTRSFLKLPIN